MHSTSLIYFISGNFPNQQFLNKAVMPKIDIINCKIEGITEVYPFVLLINKSTIVGNISIFEAFIISQPVLNKDDLCFKKHFNLE